MDEHAGPPAFPAELGTKAAVLAIQPAGIALAADRGLANQAAILLGRPLPGFWAEQILAAFDFLIDQRKFGSVAIVASGRYASLAALFATVLEPRIQHVTLDGLFESFIDIIGRDPVAEIPGILRVADVEHLLRAAGKRVVVQNPQRARFDFSPTMGLYVERYR